MNIAVLTPTYLPVVGGAEVGVFEIYRRLATRHEVTIHTPVLQTSPSFRAGEEAYFEDNRLVAARYQDGSSLEGVPPRIKSLASFFVNDYSVGALRVATALPPETDVVNCHYFFRNIGAIAQLVRRRTPVVLSMVGRDFDGIPRWHPSWLAARRVLRSCDSVVYISEYMRSLVGVACANESVIPYGVDLERYKPGPRNEGVLAKHEVPEDSTVLFTVQRLSPVKRLDVLLEAVAVVVNAHPSVTLLIGGTGDDEGRLRSMTTTLGLDANVRWCGYIRESELPEYYRTADIVAFQSMNETFGVVVPQAMASGKPLVTVRGTALREIVRHGETGLLSEPGDAGEFAANIRRLLEDRRLGETLGENALREARERFSWERVARDYEAVLMRAAGSPA